MGALCAFIVGFAGGWFAHRYRTKIDKVKKVVKDEFGLK